MKRGWGLQTANCAHRTVWRLLLALGITAAFWTGTLAADDLREQFGTRSLRAAEALDRGIKLVQDHKPREGLAPLNEALKEDAELHLAYLWKAMALADMGEIDQALAVYRELESVGRRTFTGNVVVEGCINCGLTLSTIGRQDEGAMWFSKALMFDPDNSGEMAWKAYRNMAIGHRERGRKMAAALCMVKAYEASPKNVERKGVEEFMEDAQNEEGGNVLCLTDKPPQVAPPANKEIKIKEVDQGTDRLDVRITQLLLEPLRGLMIAIAHDQETYYVYEYRKENKPAAVKAPGKVTGGSMAEGRLFLTLAQPDRIVEVDIKSGRGINTWELRTGGAESLAVFPRHGVAYYSARGELRMLDLASREESKTGLASNGVHDDPRQQCLYSFVRPEHRGPEVGHVIIDGRPVFFRTRADFDWLQSTIHRYAVVGRHRLLAGLRINAAANGQRLHVSPDGKWVLLAGGGGWRPPQADRGAGYGVAALAADDPSHVQGYFGIDAYPRGAAINPLTSHIVVLREQDARVYHLSDNKAHQQITGPFDGAAQWSGNGRYLYLTGPKGLKIFQLEVDAELLKREKNWHVALVDPLPAPPNTARAASAPEPLALLKNFEPSDKAQAVKEVLVEAKRLDRQVRPIDWQSHAPYRRDAAFDGELRSIAKGIGPRDRGPFIYRLRRLETQAPRHAVVDHFLGMMAYYNNDYDDALARHTRAIRADQGRTTVSVESLRSLAHLCRNQKRAAAAAYCYALALALDPYRAEYLDEGEKFFTADDYAPAAKALYQMGRGRQAKPGSAPQRKRGTGLPALAPVKSGNKLPPEQIFRQAAPCVVTIKTGSGSGSGFCVGQRAYVVTNQHVVEFARGDVEVVAYRQDGDKLVSLPPVAARVVYESRDTDLAVLRLDTPPESLQPLPVADEVPQVGARLFALGSPGFGEQVLVQTFSDGILSTTERRIQGQPYLQHSVSINPGNSGGPLLDEHGRVVGIVTLKARLENVGFAVSASRLREIFTGPENP